MELEKVTKELDKSPDKALHEGEIKENKEKLKHYEQHADNNLWTITFKMVKYPEASVTSTRFAYKMKMSQM